MNKISDKRKNMALVYSTSRTDVGMSQEKIASILVVSRCTVARWESGENLPDVLQHQEWFDALGISDAPYMYEFKNNDIRHNKKLTDMEKFEIAFDRTVKDLNLQQKRAINYLQVGTYQGDPFALLQLYLAHAHLPMVHRYTIANQIYEAYMICIERDEIIDKEYVLPDTEILAKAIKAGRESAIKGVHGYAMKED